MRGRFVIAVALVLAAAIAQAQRSGGISVESVWARATPPGAKTGAVYLTLSNQGSTDDQLVGVTTPVAAMAGLHTELTDHGVMEMRPIKSVDVAPGGTAVLKPGARHIMLTGLKQPLKQGGHFPLTLRFAHAAPLTVQVDIAKIGAAMPDMGMKDMKH